MWIVAKTNLRWESARQSVNDFKELERLSAGNSSSPGRNTTCEQDLIKPSSSDSTVEFLKRFRETPWTSTHAHLANMGGIHLRFPGTIQFPVNSNQLLWLVRNCHIVYPTIQTSTIADKDKADAFARVVTLLQVGWFLVHCIARFVQDLSLTPLELSTLAFSLSAFAVLFYQRHKPSGVDEPIIITVDKPLAIILQEAGQDLSHKPYYIETPLDFVEAEAEERFSYIRIFFGPFHLDSRKRPLPVQSFYNISSRPPHGLGPPNIAFAMVFVPLYYGLNFVGWWITFPTPTESLLWRIAVITQGVACISFLLLCWPGYRLGKWLCGSGRKSSRQSAFRELPRLPDPLVLLIHLIYTIARLYVIVESIVSIRLQPLVVYRSVAWWDCLPHL